jgi:hypothetical protein
MIGKQIKEMLGCIGEWSSEMRDVLWSELQETTWKNDPKLGL